jgi:prevent-host-death family protein
MTVMSVKELENNLPVALERVVHGQGRVIISSQGKPQAALVSLDDLRRLEHGDDLEERIRESIKEYRPGVTVPTTPVEPGQEWFWTEDWQAAEREAEADLETGQHETFDNDRDFIASLV